MAGAGPGWAGLLRPGRFEAHARRRGADGRRRRRNNRPGRWRGCRGVRARNQLGRAEPRWFVMSFAGDGDIHIRPFRARATAHAAAAVALVAVAGVAAAIRSPLAVARRSSPSTTVA